MVTADPDTHTGTTDSDDDRLVDGLCYDCRLKEIRSRRREMFNGEGA
jgi:hypothetical protein